MLGFNSPLALAGVILCFGLGQSLLLTPLMTVLLDIVAREMPGVPASRALALARSFERVGGILGAVLAAVFSASLGYRDATAVLGLIVLILGLGTLQLLRTSTSRVVVNV
jgi:predicted MFS family arabinose efflux permease